MDEFNTAVLVVVSQIPEGRVATYGQVAELAGFKNYARHVSRALVQAPAELALPWHRVINAKGQISHRGTPGAVEHQQILLEDEGVEVGLHGKIKLAQFQWQPFDES